MKMDAPEVETRFDTSAQETFNNDAKEDSSDNECWEDDFNPLGLLDLVYVEGEEEKNKVCEKNTESSASTSNDLMDQQRLTNSNSNDSDEDEEILEPFAAVDVLPGREEDFLPEGLTQEIMEPCRTTWMIPRVSDANMTYHQWSFQDPGAFQPAIGIPPLVWTIPNPLHSLQTSQDQFNEFQNQLPGGNFVPSLSWKPTTSQDQAKFNKQKNYYQRYRERNRELVRIRNREYARRYRETHAERVRQRQRDYIKRYRERKKLLQQEQAGLFNGESGQYNVHSMFENGILAAALLSDGKTINDMVAQDNPEIPNISEQVILEDSDQSEIVVLS